MGSMDSGKHILGLMAYFFIFFLAIWGLQSTLVNYEIDGINYTGAKFQDATNPFEAGQFLCKSSRRVNQKNILNTDLDCSTTYLNDDIDSCNSVAGCNWTNTTTFLFFFEKEVPYYCDGKLDTTALNGNVTYSPLWGFDVCELANLQTNQSLCQNLGCQWFDVASMGEASYNLNDKASFVGVWDTIKFVTGFNVNLLDFPPLYYFIFSFVFFWVPLVWLIIAIYFSLPFLH